MVYGCPVIYLPVISLDVSSALYNETVNLMEKMARQQRLKIINIDRSLNSINIVNGTQEGEATIQLAGGAMLNAEIHWYEAHGIGKYEFKIKRYLK